MSGLSDFGYFAGGVAKGLTGGAGGIDAGKKVADYKNNVEFNKALAGIIEGNPDTLNEIMQKYGLKLPAAGGIANAGAPGVQRDIEKMNKVSPPGAATAVPGLSATGEY